MKYPNNRRANTTLPAGGGPIGRALDDHYLVTRILELSIGDKFRADLSALAEKLAPGKFGQIHPHTRDRLVKFAMQHGAIPRVKKKPTAGLHAYCDTYDSRETPGTARAVSLISSQVPRYGGAMPVPPGRRTA